MRRSRTPRTMIAGLPLATSWLLHAGSHFSAAAASQEQMKTFSFEDIFTVLFLMLGPIKIIGPFARITYGADRTLIRQLASRATLVASLVLLLAAFLGERLLVQYGIPVPVLILAAGIVLFLVALLPIVQQFNPPERSEGEATAPTLSMAVTPLAFPTIVTPYGIAALIVFVALSPNLESKLIISVIVLAIMLLNLIAMLLAHHILRSIGVFLYVLGSVLGIIQVALGLQVILSSIQDALRMMAP